jgi:hypothetical protein
MVILTIWTNRVSSEVIYITALLTYTYLDCHKKYPLKRVEIEIA